MDGDKIGHKSWAAIIEAARSCGKVTHVHWYAPPGRGENPEVAKALKEMGVSFVAVPCRLGGTGDPIDMAMALHAAYLVGRREVNHVALAVRDADFLYLAEQLPVLRPCKVSLLLPRPGFAHLEQAFARVNASTVMYSAGADNGGLARFHKLKAVLQSDGTGSFEQISADEDANCCPADSALAPLLAGLRSLGYTDQDEDPLVPAFAKFAHVNKLGPFTVWPHTLAATEALELWSSCDRATCQPNPGNLAFVLPRRQGLTATARQLQTYGTTLCALFARAGTPFLERGCDGIVGRVLSRLGYFTASLDMDLEQAINAFCVKNRRELVELQIPVSSIPTVRGKEALLQCALLSPKSSGEWKIAPKDSSVKTMLVRQGFLRHEGASQAAVLQAMQAYIGAQGLNVRQQATTSQCLQAIHKHLRRANPVGRK